jgi:hypothetical protein
MRFQRNVTLLLGWMKAFRCGAQRRRGARGGVELTGVTVARETCQRGSSTRSSSLACLPEDSSWRFVGSVERPRWVNWHSARRRRKQDEWAELGGHGHVTAGIVARGKTAQEASEWGSGHGRLGACDCKVVREERYAVEPGPVVTFATGRLLGSVCRPSKQAFHGRTPWPRITEIINGMCACGLVHD